MYDTIDLQGVCTIRGEECRKDTIAILWIYQRARKMRRASSMARKGLHDDNLNSGLSHHWNLVLQSPITLHISFLVSSSTSFGYFEPVSNIRDEVLLKSSSWLTFPSIRLIGNNKFSAESGSPAFAALYFAEIAPKDSFGLRFLLSLL